ncbi:MAG TPA: pyridoxal phosphate-dependent aminotransferase [Chloroflexia bacterium]|nr:pyridoxal phosphate-dependent aminotransferase [Chloroflexia bacterium]
MSTLGQAGQDTAPVAPVQASSNGALSEQEQVEYIRQVRRAAVGRYRPIFQQSRSPIREMARMMAEVVSEARKAGISPAIVSRELVNRTIGDVNVRLITEKIGGVDYSTIGEDLGLILPGETIGGRVSDGAVHTELNRREEQIEMRLLRDYNWDMRIYDVFGMGNPLLREKLAARFQKAWGIPATPAKTYISIGALDALYKSILSLGSHFRKKYGVPAAFAFPAPGFAVVNWQVETSGSRLLLVRTAEENNFKLTYGDVKRLLNENPDLRMLYLTVSNNPTAFAYTPAEIRDVYRAIVEDGREFVVLADLAYVGTGDSVADAARMAAFNTPEALERTLFVSSFSKVFTMTGDRMGFVTFANDSWADILIVAWNNTTAGLPAQWQLRYTALVEWLDEHPEIQAKIKALYDLRRDHLREELRALNEQHRLFEVIGMDDHATIYNWSKLMPGEDALSLFEETGIAGVSGSAFGYDDRYIRFSVGFTPIPTEG